MHVFHVLLQQWLWMLGKRTAKENGCNQHSMYVPALYERINIYFVQAHRAHKTSSQVAILVPVHLGCADSSGLGLIARPPTAPRCQGFCAHPHTTWRRAVVSNTWPTKLSLAAQPVHYCLRNIRIVIQILESFRRLVSINASNFDAKPP